MVAVATVLLLGAVSGCAGDDSGPGADGASDARGGSLCGLVGSLDGCAGADAGTRGGGGETGGGGGSLCGPDVADQLSQTLADIGYGAYAFTAGSSDGTDCSFGMTHDGERWSNTLRVVVGEPQVVPEECTWGYRIDSDSYSYCPDFEVYWTFYTEEFRGNSNRLAEYEALAVHQGVWEIIGEGLDRGLRPSDAAA